MKAIRVKEFGGPEVLCLEEVPTPQAGPGQLVVRIHAIGVNPVETYIRAGTYARLPELPYTPGNDGAGVVEQVGADVTEFKAGDRVYTAGSISGTYAEFALCKNEQVHPLPANVSFGPKKAIVPNVTSVSATNSARYSLDFPHIRQKMTPPTANETTTKRSSTAIMYAAKKPTGPRGPGVPSVGDAGAQLA